jgi:hypothetical protein
MGEVQVGREEREADLKRGCVGFWVADERGFGSGG